jgi:tRNA(fMet)-specific endonuclease VapC
VNCILDTNIVSLAMAGDDGVLGRIARLEPGSAAISAVTYAEIRYGLQRMASIPLSKSRRQELVDREVVLERLLDHVDVLAWDDEAAVAYASERVACERDGEPLSQLDLMILAHACSTERVLVTRDSALQRRSKKGHHRAEVVSW